MANVKLSQIVSGGAVNTGTDTAVVVRSGTTDLLVTLGALASVTPAAGISTFLTTPSSANLAAAVTDETGSGALVFATSPTFVTPALGTPASGVGTNLTGTASGLTAGNVTTNANLTGPITSAGNATTITANAVTTTTINASAVTYAKIQNETASTLLGNPTGSGAAPSEITLGTNLSFSGSVLNATGGGSSAFNAITSGTNTTAAMIVGTGASLAASGSGTIAATTVVTNANLTGPITSVGNATTITASSVTYANIQNESASTLLGNPTGSGAAPSEITLGSGLSFSGSVLKASGGSFVPLPQTVVSATSASAAVNNGYIANNAALCTITLPASATVGQLVQVSGQGAGGWAIAQNSGQSIIFNTSTTTAGVGGSLASTHINDNVLLMNTVANTTWLVISSQGNINGV